MDTSTCEDRLLVLAMQPEYHAIRGELMHAAAELNGLRQVIHFEMTIIPAMIDAGLTYMQGLGTEIERHRLADLFTTMQEARYPPTV